jgi:hypothetical protein
MVRQNYFQSAFGPSFRNEANPPAASAASVDTGGPLPGMMPMMQIGDPIETTLPSVAVEKSRKQELKSDEAHVLLRATIEAQQETRTEIQRRQARIKRLTQHPHEGGFGLAEDDPRVVDEKNRLDRKLDEQRRLNAVCETRAATWKSTAELVRNIEQAVAARPGGYVAKMVSLEAPPLKKGETIFDAVEGRRRRGRELQADLHRIRSSPWPSALAKQRMRERIGQLAESGRPFVECAVEHNEPIPFPAQNHQVRILNGDPSLIGFAELPDTLALLAWLHRDALIAALDREIDAVADDPNSMNHEQRQKAEAQVRADLLAVEREECVLIEIGQAQGLPVEYRSDCDPRAILGFEWVPAPTTVSREGDGQAGVVRRVGP